MDEDYVHTFILYIMQILNEQKIRRINNMIDDDLDASKYIEYIYIWLYTYNDLCYKCFGGILALYSLGSIN